MSRIPINIAELVGGTPMGFCMDGITLVALVLGAKGSGDEAIWARTCEWWRFA